MKPTSDQTEIPAPGLFKALLWLVGYKPDSAEISDETIAKFIEHKLTANQRKQVIEALTKNPEARAKLISSYRLSSGVNESVRSVGSVSPLRRWISRNPFLVSATGLSTAASVAFIFFLMPISSPPDVDFSEAYRLLGPTQHSLSFGARSSIPVTVVDTHPVTDRDYFELGISRAKTNMSTQPAKDEASLPQLNKLWLVKLGEWAEMTSTACQSQTPVDHRFWVVQNENLHLILQHESVRSFQVLKPDDSSERALCQTSQRLSGYFTLED